MKMETRKIIKVEFDMATSTDTQVVSIPNDVVLIEKVFGIVTSTMSVLEFNFEYVSLRLYYPEFEQNLAIYVPIKGNQKLRLMQDAFDVNLPVTHDNSAVKLKIIAHRLIIDTKLTVYLICKRKHNGSRFK